MRCHKRGTCPLPVLSRARQSLPRAAAGSPGPPEEEASDPRLMVSPSTDSNAPFARSARQASSRSTKKARSRSRVESHHKRASSHSDSEDRTVYASAPRKSLVQICRILRQEKSPFIAYLVK